MDGDGELQPGDDVSTFMPCASESGERHNGSSTRDVTNNDNNGCYDADKSSSGGGRPMAVSKTGGQDEEGGGGGTSIGDDDENDEGDETAYKQGYANQVQIAQIEDDGSDDDSDDVKMHIDIPGEDDEDDQDSLDGGPSSSTGVSEVKERPMTEKRVPIKSQRMRDYQEMQQTVNQFSRPRSCPYCGRVLRSGPGYRYHVNSHKVKESFTCDNCHKRFKSFNGLKYHRKRKRCSGIGGTLSESATGSSAVTTATCATTTRVSATAQGSDVNRLMELAQIATGPQSPLLQSPGPDSRVGAPGHFFDYSETSAAITLSMMRNSDEACSSNQPRCMSVQIHPNHPHHHQIQQPQPPVQVFKPKRPMNGFMLYAQQHRAELKKKYPQSNNRMISTKLSEEWSRLPDDERQRWKDDARIRAEKTRKEHPDCWKRKK